MFVYAVPHDIERGVPLSLMKNIIMSFSFGVPVGLAIDNDAAWALSSYIDALSMLGVSVAVDVLIDTRCLVRKLLSACRELLIDGVTD